MKLVSYLLLYCVEFSAVDIAIESIVSGQICQIIQIQALLNAGGMLISSKISLHQLLSHLLQIHDLRMTQPSDLRSRDILVIVHRLLFFAPQGIGFNLFSHIDLALKDLQLIVLEDLLIEILLNLLAELAIVSFLLGDDVGAGRRAHE